MYTHNELLVLHHLRRYGPILAPVKGTIYTGMAAELGMKVSTLKYLLRKLEGQCIVLRTWERPQSNNFADTHGLNRLIRLELVDPNLSLPAIPQVYQQHEPPKLPLAVTMERENQELERKVNHQRDHEPTVESIIEALIDRALELQKQVDKLQDVIEGLTKENARLTKPKPAPHLSSRVRDVLTNEQWDNLRRKP